MDCSDCGEEIDEDNESQPVCPACGGSDFEDDFDLEEFEEITFHPVAAKSEAPTVKSVLYEQVPGVKVWVVVFPSAGSFLLLLLVSVAPHVALHRVSIRTLMS